MDNQLRYAKKQTAYAWAKYYQQLETNHQHRVNQYNLNHRMVGVDELPQHLVDEIAGLNIELKKEISCPICFDIIENLKITGCGHKYCNECFKKIDKCSICRKKINKR